MEDCIFCKIAKGEIPSHKIWEDKEHLAFLSIFPNTEGFTVIIPKSHHTSYVFNAEDNVINKLMMAAKKVAKLIDKSFEDVGRTGLIFEGFGVDHLHAKLFPMHGTKMEKWKAVHSNVDKYFKMYEGYISSHDYKREDDKKLAKIAEKIKSNNQKVFAFTTP